MRIPSILAAALLTITSASAQVMNIGNDVDRPNSSDFPIATVRTDIDLANPATATGTISVVKFEWSASGCSAALKIKFFRRFGNVMKMIAERGPFGTDVRTITLADPVTVTQGDLIGITSLIDCGNPVTFMGGPPTEGCLVYAGDVIGAVDVAAGRYLGATLAVFGSGSATESVKGIVTNVGATAGSFGSQFKTALQLFNPFDYEMRGRVDFRPAGSAYNVANSVLYTLQPGDVVAYPDIVGTTLGQTGLGTLDIVATAGQDAPLGIVRVYNDAGLEGTSAFTEPIIDPEVTRKGLTHILKRGMTGYLVVPIQPDRTRFNIGVRTLWLGATMNVSLRDATGTALRTVVKTFPPNWYEQNSALVFLGVDVQPNQTVELSVTAGSAIVYGTTTDNTTNDPNIQFATIIFSTGG